MIRSQVRTALFVVLVGTSVATAAGQPVPAQIKTIDIPPSQSELPPALTPAPAPPEPAVETSGGLNLVLPTVDEARAIDGKEIGSDTTGETTTGVDTDAAGSAMAAIEASRLRRANAEQLAAARRQLDQISADKQAARDRLARYREAEAAHAAAVADYEAQLEASRAARRRWELDVAACQAGQRERCQPAATLN